MGWLMAAGVVALPVAEIMVWLRMAEWIGGWNTVGLTMLSFLAGTAILRRQGLRLMLEARARMERGEEMVPDAGFDGLCLALAGLLLVLPGFISDAAALLLLLPPVRRLIRHGLAAHVTVFAARTDPTVIEGDFTVVSEGGPPEHDSKRLEP